MTKKISISCYSNEKGKGLIGLCDGRVDGVRINSCHPYWYRSCKAEGKCQRFFPDGTRYRDIALAKLLKKPVSRLTYYDKSGRADGFRQKGFKACKRIKVVAFY